MPEYSFPISERLKSRKMISAIFRSGISLNQYPLRIIYLSTEPHSGRSSLQVAFSVPKRNVKGAVNRNLMKRRMREAYRLHRRTYFPDSSATPSNPSIALVIICISHKMESFQSIEKGMIRLLKKLAERSL